MKNSQKIQEEEYNFPYHYIPQYKPEFTQTTSWSWGMNYISSIEFIINRIKKEEFNSLADLGTGDGRLTMELNKSFSNKKILGIDYSEKAINLARAFNPGLEFLAIDIIKEKINFKFDIITLIEVFEHIEPGKCDIFISSLKNLLNGDGILFLTVPHKNKPLQKKHFQHFTYESLKNYFEQDFEIIETVYFEKNTKLVRILKLLLQNKFFILNNKILLNWIYRVYKKYFFIANKKNCGRVFLKLKKK